MKEILLKGIERSGTNYISGILRDNLIDTKLRDTHRNKHWVFPKDFKRKEDTLYLLCVRDPYKWSQAILGKANRVREKLDQPVLSMLDFVDTPRNKIYGDKPYRKGKLDDLYSPIRLRNYPNMLTMRTDRLWEMYAMKDEVPNFLIVDYDKVYNNPEWLFYRLSVEGIKGKLLLKLDARNKYKNRGETYVPREYPELTSEEIKALNSKLDWNLEGKLGFEKR